jgi:cob(I)alamin adenosyltransferase
MGKRLTKIYTRTGDEGTTGLGDGTRILKDASRVEAIGAVDELNSFLGLLLAEDLEAGIRLQLEHIQHELFDLGGDLSIPGRVSMRATQVAHLEKGLDEFNATLEPLREFVLPGGARAAALCHVARSISRRAERRVVRLYLAEPAIPIHMHYLNRLSDLLFVLSRVLNRQNSTEETMWQPVDSKLAVKARQD